MNKDQSKTRDQSYSSYLRANHFLILIAIALFIPGWILLLLTVVLWSKVLGAIAIGASISICMFSAWKDGVIYTNNRKVSRQENPTLFSLYMMLCVLFSVVFWIALLLKALELL